MQEPPHAGPPRRVQKDPGPFHIRPDEIARLQDGAVYVGLRGEMDDLIRLVIGVAVAACLSALTAGIVRWRAGDASARYYAFAWSSMLLGGIVKPIQV